MKEKLVEVVYCVYDGLLVFKYESGNSRIEPACLNRKVASKARKVNFFSYEYARMG